MNRSAPVGRLCETGELLEAGTTVAVPEDVRELFRKFRKRFRNFARTDHENIDALLRKVRHRLRSFGRADVVTHDRRREAVVGREVLCEIYQRLIVTIVVTGSCGSYPDRDRAVAVCVKGRHELVGFDFHHRFFFDSFFLLSWLFPSRIFIFFFNGGRAIARRFVGVVIVAAGRSDH